MKYSVDKLKELIVLDTELCYICIEKVETLHKRHPDLSKVILKILNEIHEHEASELEKMYLDAFVK